jgi:hypothetical protein
MTVTTSLAGEGCTLDNGLVRLDLTRREGRLIEQILGWRDGWHPVLSTRLAPAGEAGLDLEPVCTRVAVVSCTPEAAHLRLEGASGLHAFTVDVRLRDGDRFLSYRVEHAVGAQCQVRALQSRYTFAASTVDFSFAPHLRPHAGDVVGQFAFKSPASIVQSGSRTAALIADVDLIGAEASQLVCLEPDVDNADAEGPMLAYGYKDHEPYGLIYFGHRPDMIASLNPGHRQYGYHLYANAASEPSYGYRDVVRLLWRLYGARSAASVIPQVLPIDRYEDYALGYAIPALWRDLERDGVACGAITMGIKFPGDVWFHFFFNHLHTAYGLYRMGQRRGRQDLIERAVKIRNLLLSAERKGGAIPAIFSQEIITGIRRDRWIPHAHWVGGFIPYQTQIAGPVDQPAYSTLDGAWTCYWMLRWHQELEEDARLVSWARDYADLMCRAQLPSGAVPVWLHQDTLQPLDFLRESPSCAGVGLFLAKLYEVTREPRYLDAAERVAEFIATRVMPQGWADYECFHDSAGKPVDLVDHYSGQRPQCTFPIFWTAELGKLLFGLTGTRAYLDHALRAVDYLLLFQGVWSPPYLSVKGFGSIGIGNGHTGWNDARSGIFAPGIAEFYTLTGEHEYLARGVAAMRAPLALMYIPENEPVSTVFDKGPTGYADECYAHRGRDARLGPSTYDFSVGYAFVAFEELVRRYGAVHVDAAARRGVGIDGATVADVSVADGVLSVRIDDAVGIGARPKLTVRGARADISAIALNGQERLALTDPDAQGYRFTAP